MSDPHAIEFICPVCRCEVRAVAAMAGRNAMCPVCEQAITVPKGVPPRALLINSSEIHIVSRPEQNSG